MDADFTRTGSGFKLIVERRLDHPMEKVWRVLTERDLMRQWFPADVKGEWKVGAPLQFTFLHGEGEGLPDDELRGEVLSVEPPSLLEFRWGSGIIRFELRADADACVFALSETLDDASMGARNAAGWEMCLENLDTILQAGSIAKFAWEVWQGKFDRYVKKFEGDFGPQQEPPPGIHS